MDLPTPARIVMAVMQDWIVKCERSLALIMACAAACLCVLPSCHAFDLNGSDPVQLWELAVSIAVVSAFFAAVVLWIYSAHRRFRLRERRKTKFASSALNNLPHGIVMFDSRRHMVFCNDRYLEIYRLSRSDIRPRMPLGGSARAAQGARDL